MNVTETALVLDRMATAYRVEVPQEALEIWSKHLANVEADVAMDAVENVIGTETFFPTVALFQKEVAAELRHRAKERLVATTRGEAGPDHNCPFCHGVGWAETEPRPLPTADGEIQVVFEQWTPCEPCNPVGYLRWLEYKVEAAAVTRHRRGPDGNEFDVKAVIHEVRDLLGSE